MHFGGLWPNHQVDVKMDGSNNMILNFTMIQQTQASEFKLIYILSCVADDL